MSMLAQYQKLSQGKMVGKCTLASFENDLKPKLLAAKREMLDRMSFAFHGE